MNIYELFEAGTGVVASSKQARDPRYSMSLSPDVRPGEITKQLKKYNLAEGEENTARLDRILVDLCEGIIRHKKHDTEHYGLVAAAVVDPEHRVVYGINNLQSNGKRVHAERAAIDNYKQKHGELPEGSIIVTTLSPCTEPMPDREGISCTELIDSTPVRRVYAGYRDPTQDHLAHDDFDVVITNNDKIQQLCKSIADCFLKEPVAESRLDVNSVADEFVEFVNSKLRFKQAPNIEFVEQVTGTEHPTFGMFDSNTNTIQVATAGRHVMDAMRTLAHELVHHKQRETKPEAELDGGTASRDENQANRLAGTYMREFADQHPEYFEVGSLNEDTDAGVKKIRFADGYLAITKHAVLRMKERNIPIDAVYAVLHKLEVRRGDELPLMPFLPFVVKTDKFGIAISKQRDQKDHVAYVVNTVHPSLRSSDDQDVVYLENFADGKHPEDKGDSKRYHVPTKASVSTLRKVAKQGGRKGQLAHWMANMKAGRAKARKK